MSPEPRAGQVPAATAGPGQLPKYKRLDRKELLIWPDQLTGLEILARRLNRQRAGQGERITPNTLIRVAIALLLDQAADLGGASEAELRAALGLRPVD